ncbi:hypothetical protein ACFOTA_07940 [Chitinophaga sp. GCM10012297]|uniref:Uncharacterized protein n=1 Tax=Chitinophaga chungangae TaxID=2821488 RepID=A0ABS3YBU0_9BACT|nr:hypothetical protein [Chitinophaga chungangae]MBO9152134.1 hypothetical protein [Chitinophaga chungangae]
MQQEIIGRIAAACEGKNIVDALAALPGADFNTLLLEVFNRRAAALSAPGLLLQYKQNRFVKPADMNAVVFATLQLATLQTLERMHFSPVMLSPVSPLGSCSVFGAVSQEKVMSATRGAEVLADATNALALHIAELKQQGAIHEADLCAVQRHVRTQPLPSKAFTPHFTIACLTSAGMDRGSYRFECESLYKHAAAWAAVLRGVFGITQMRLRLIAREGTADGNALLTAVSGFLAERLPEVSIEKIVNSPKNNYYTGIQFKVVIQVKEQEWEIVDGGFTTWTQQLLGNKKERLLISGFGLELLKRVIQE